MCLVLLAQKMHPEYPLIILFNRDEWHKRPTQTLSYWPEEGMYAGRDLIGEGTWLGMQADGRFALVTNLHTNRGHEALTSRGLLVRDYLKGEVSPMDYIQQIQRQAFNPFNLICGNLKASYYYCSDTEKTVQLDNGLQGLSNTALETPWSKVERAKTLFRTVLSHPVVTIADCLSVLGDHHMATTDAHSAIFVVDPVHGTRSSSVIMINQAGEVIFHEETFNPNGEPEHSTEIRFHLSGNDRGTVDN